MSIGDLGRASVAWPLATLRRAILRSVHYLRDLRPRQAAQTLVPRTLFGRATLAIMVPTLVLQIFVTWLFYDILWDNVMGLKPGTQILFEGYQIGLIHKIERSPEADSGGPNYRVEIEVEKGWPIPVSAAAETTAPSFLAALVVNINAGDSDAILEPIDEGTGFNHLSVRTAVAIIVDRLLRKGGAAPS